MIYAAKKADETFTGATYDALTPAIRAHHAQYGETLALVSDLINTGTDLEPVWEAEENDLATRKILAVEQAREEARAIRQMAAQYAPYEKALGWTLKCFFAFAWRAYEVNNDAGLAPFEEIARAGFDLETGLTGEDPVTVRDQSITSAGRLFRALQLVDGMEHLAETRFPAVTTVADLEATITQLRSLEAQALTELTTVIQEGGTTNA